MKKFIHIWNLPIERVYIRLESKFRKKFFNLVYQKFKNWNNAGKFLNIKRADTTLARNWRKGNISCPLGIIFKLAKVLNISKSTIEKKIIEIKCKTRLDKRGGNTGKSIKDPKLPIKVDENLVEILGHICGDGTICRTQPHKGISFRYINSEPTLIKEFKEKMRLVFGNIEPNIQVRDDKSFRYSKSFHYTKPNYVLQYPTIVSLFVLSIFDYKTKDNKELPGFVFDMSNEEKCKFLRAILDDEGYVYDKKIALRMKPRCIIENIKLLLESIGIKTSKVVELKSGMHLIKIAKGNYVKKFKDLVGFKHPRKKRILNKIVSVGWKFKRYDNYEAQVKIIRLLKRNKQLSVKDLSSYLNRHCCTIREHLKNLKTKGIVDSIIKQDRYSPGNREWFLIGDKFGK